MKTLCFSRTIGVEQMKEIPRHARPSPGLLLLVVCASCAAASDLSSQPAFDANALGEVSDALQGQIDGKEHKADTKNGVGTVPKTKASMTDLLTQLEDDDPTSSFDKTGIVCRFLPMVRSDALQPSERGEELIAGHSHGTLHDADDTDEATEAGEGLNFMEAFKRYQISKQKKQKQKRRSKTGKFGSVAANNSLDRSRARDILETGGSLQPQRAPGRGEAFEAMPRPFQDSIRRCTARALRVLAVDVIRRYAHHCGT
jgi:hypothetical protein